MTGHTAPEYEEPQTETLRQRVAILVPCLNEAPTIGAVVSSFRDAVPGAEIYVYDNNSVDGTAEIAAESGAIVRHEPRQGKGNVVRRMFADVVADVYVLVDGDGTYDAAAALSMLKKFNAERLDFLNASRIEDGTSAYRAGHRFGNRILTRMVQMIFGLQFDDMLSGYKVLSRRYVKSFPSMSSGFEIETELAVHALELNLPMAEMPTQYRERPEGSFSKLRTLRDGTRILILIARLVKDERPFQLFGTIGILSILIGLILGGGVVVTFLDTGLVPRLPTALLSIGMVILGVVSIFSGLILDVVTRSRREFKRLFYLSAE